MRHTSGDHRSLQKYQLKPLIPHPPKRKNTIDQTRSDNEPTVTKDPEETRTPPSSPMAAPCPASPLEVQESAKLVEAQQPEATLSAETNRNKENNSSFHAHVQSLQVPGVPTRIRAIMELSQSETRYQKDLRCVLEALSVLSAWSPAKEFQLTYSNLSDLLDASTQLGAILQRILTLDDAMSSNQLGLELIHIVPLLNGFETYIANHTSSEKFFLSLMDKKKELISKLAAMRTTNLPNGVEKDTFFAWLMVPIQRVMRYPMLLQKILGDTPNTHADYPGLHDALRRFMDLAQQANKPILSQEKLKRCKKRIKAE